MKTIVRLMLAYFFGVPWLRWFSLCGVLLIAMGTSMAVWAPGVLSADVFMFVGFAALFVGSALMPLMFGTLAGSRLIRMLPLGRAKVFASALLATGLVALPLPMSSVLALINNLPNRMLRSDFYAGGTLLDFLISTFFWQLYAVTLFGCTWLYVALWFATSSRTVAGLMRSLVVLIAVLFVPPAFVSIRPDIDPVVPISMTLGSWLLIGLTAALLPHIRNRLSMSGMRGLGGLRYAAGRELDLFLGTAAPWLLALALALPLLLATRFIAGTGIWLFYLTILSTVSGAIAGNAAARARSVWLLTSLSRSELFSRAERLFWRHNSYGLVVLLLLLIAICAYSGLPASLIAWGAPLLILSTFLSMYLGLMMTRGLQWRDVPLVTGIMLALMATALLAAREPAPTLHLAVLEGSLCAIAIICRFVARARWSRLDWSQCRVNRGATAAPSF